MRRPLAIYDARCAFCRRAVTRLARTTRGRVRYVPAQRPGRLAYWGIPRDAARRALQLVERSGRRYQGAAAVFRALRRSRAGHWRAVARVGRLPGIAQLAEVGYRVVARHRRAAGALERVLVGVAPDASSHAGVRRAYLRALGLVYLCAFTSLRAQVLGLYGRQGVLPIAERLARIRARAPTARERWRAAPTVFWLDASDAALVRRCREGQLLAVALTLDVAPRATAARLWALYLSFVAVGGDFLAFQWDALLLEAGLHAALFGPPVQRARRREAPTTAEVLVMRWLLFRLHFESGVVKLRSPDRCWRDRSALCHYYQTAPLPTALGWYAHHLPARVQRFSTAATVAIECGAPWLLFGPRPARRAAAAALTALQALIALTGNYGFFNLLTGVLGVWALDDAALHARPTRRPARRPTRVRRLGRALLAAGVALVSAAGVRLVFARRRRAAPRWALGLLRAVAPLLSVNTYGPFSVMTRERPEIVVEGSDDGVTWRRYAFKYKVDAPARRPPWVAPHQPRLDWQMWFAALAPAPPAWFIAFVTRLLEGSPAVLGLLASNPFPDRPPRYARASLEAYTTTDLAERRATGTWWQTRPLGEYLPPVRLG